MLNRYGRNGSVIALAFTLFVGHETLAATEDSLRVAVLDVGEGQSVLLQRGSRGVLVDTGHFGKARTVLDRLETLEVRHLDYLFLTHLHPDHASGYFRIREAFPNMTVVDSGENLPSDFDIDSVRWVHSALAKDPKRSTMRAGDNIVWEGVHVRVLWPQRVEAGRLNRNSLVLEFSLREHTVLIMGDAPKDAEKTLLDEGKLPDKVDLLVVGHHGSRTASAKSFLSAISPRIAAISVDRNNIRGYPSPGTLQRLNRFADRVLRTYRDGEICFEWSQGETEPRPCRHTD